MRTLCLVLWLTLISLAAVPYCAADELSEYEIVFQYNEDGCETKIDFIRKDTKTIINTFDLREHNPYENLSYPIIKDLTSAWGFTCYDLKTVNREQLLARYLPYSSVESTKWLNFSMADSRVAVYNWIDPAWEKFEKKYAAISYVFEVRKNNKNIVAAQSTIFVLNAKGEIIFRTENLPMNCEDPLVTEDGRYLTFRCGGALDESLRSVTPGGFRIYDMTNGELIVDRKLDNGFYSISGPSVKYDRIIYHMETEWQVKYLFYDFDKRLVYTKIYPIDLYSSGIAYIPDGLAPRENPTSEIRKEDKFAKDFEKEAF